MSYQYDHSGKYYPGEFKTRMFLELLTLYLLLVVVLAPASITQALGKDKPGEKSGHGDSVLSGKTMRARSDQLMTSQTTYHVMGEANHDDHQQTIIHVQAASQLVQSSKQLVATFNEIQLPSGIALPIAIKQGLDGSYWVTDLQSGTIDRVTNNGNVISYSIPTANTDIEGITLATDGTLWFAENNRIGHLATTSSASKTAKDSNAATITEYKLPAPNVIALGITQGPDDAIWFAEDTLNKIGRINNSGTVNEYLLPATLSDPTDITAGPDGALWFTETDGNRIGRLTTRGILTEFPLPTRDTKPFSITTGPDGALWFTERTTNRIGRLTSAGILTEFQVPTPTSVLSRISAVGDGTIAFTEEHANQIGRITMDGSMSEFTLPTPDALPFSITGGKQGSVWFTEMNTGQIGNLTFPILPSTQPDMELHQKHTPGAGRSLGRAFSVTMPCQQSGNGFCVHRIMPLAGVAVRAP
ncbi:Vgb family protein [Dictyobacter arantiisoli]|uniref:Virginiamycin B lyase n=1 Tax=Dictyobacter arantiisoli TaxID=2014874 RepID=A0A5A5TCG5_9CHLR|nr:hypothetical protein [Dictyobacter arantiisoli]GCF08709.1 hypothetical protein KDI_22730 [Dictyobacter arantiisoli]